MNRRYRGLLAFLLTAASFIPAAYAQTTTGRIGGTVLDSSGGVLPGVTVSVTETRTGLTRTTTTDGQGAYIFVSLPRGIYTVAAELSGFKKGVRSGNELVADGRMTVDFRMEVGQLSETLEVTAPGETVNTTSGEVARTVDREQVQNLALNGRNYMQLATLIPGAPLLEANLNALDIMTGLGINTSVNGSRGNASLLMVDGGFNMDSGSNNSQISNVGIDFIEEVNIKTANFSAEYGRNSGAAINVVTRSGTNRFHGSVFEYNRNEAFDANDYFNNARSVKRAPLDYNDYGWSLGGPVQKNKLFFFGGQEWKKIRRLTAPALRTIPTRAMRNGDFSAVTTVVRDPETGQPFPGNVIPTGRITPDGRAIANFFDAMEGIAQSYDDRPVANNALFQAENPFDFRQDLIRVDYQPTTAHRLTLRIIHDNYDLDDPFGTFISAAGSLPNIPTNRTRPGRNYQASHTWTIKPNVINELKAGGAWNSQRVPPVGEAWKRDTYGFVFPQLFADGGRFEDSIPDTTIAGYATFFGAARSLLSPTTDLSASDNITWIKNEHTLKGGALVIRNRKDQNARSLYAGALDFNPSGNNRTSGQAFADALLGNFRTYSEAQSDPVGFFRFYQIESYVSDNWRVSRNLSVEAGVRYLWHQPIRLQANNMANFDPALYDPARAMTVNRNGTLVPASGERYNGMIRAGDGVPEEELSRVPNGNSPIALSVPAGAPRGLYHDQHLFAPRFSFAWTPNDGRMAVRGGAGLFFDRPEGNLLFGGGANGPINSPPYNLSSSYENGNLAAPGGGAVPALAPLGAIAAIDPNMNVPRSWNFSLTVQRELGLGIFGEIGYVGSRGRQLLRQVDINLPTFDELASNAALQPASARANTNFLRPYKGYSSILQRVSDGRSEYDALQLFLSKRRGSLRWTLSYTLSRAKDNASVNDTGRNTTELIDFAFDDAGNFGFSDFDRPHIVVGTATWQVPVFKSQKGVGRVLGGWEISTIARLQSGAPFTVTANTTIGNRRADFLGGDPYLPKAERIDPATGQVIWLNRSAFAPAPEDRIGTATRAQFRGPGLHVWDVSLRKQFALKGDVKMQFQADFFNVMNHTNFRNPQANMNNANFATGANTANSDFGVISQAVPPRNVQLGVRLTF